MIIATSDIIDLTPLVPNSTWNYIESLLETSVLDERQRKYFMMDIEDIDEAGAEKAILYLLTNQQNPVTERGAYKATELSKFLKKKCHED